MSEDFFNLLKMQLSSGRSVFPLLLPQFKEQLNAGLKLIPNEKLPLFIKTMFYYKIITSEELASGNEKMDEIVGKNLRHIQEGMIFNRIEKIDLRILNNPSCAEDLELHLCYVSACTFRGASHPHFFGLIFINEENFKSSNEKSISIIHELAHQELFLINMADRLVKSSNSYRLIHSPLQGRARPPIGRLHSAHALYRMIQNEMKIPSGNIEKYRTYLSKTLETFEPGELTRFGEFLLQCYKTIL